MSPKIYRVEDCKKALEKLVEISDELVHETATREKDIEQKESYVLDYVI